MPLPPFLERLLSSFSEGAARGVSDAASTIGRGASVVGSVANPVDPAGNFRTLGGLAKFFEDEWAERTGSSGAVESALQMGLPTATLSQKVLAPLAYGPVSRGEIPNIPAAPGLPGA